MNAQPTIERLICACGAASLAAASPTLLVGPLAFFAFPIGTFIAAGHMLLLGLPAYLLLRRYVTVTYAWAVGAGFVTGAAPTAILTAIRAARHSEGLYPGQILVVGLLGAFGGLVFRAVIGLPSEPASLSRPSDA